MEAQPIAGAPASGAAGRLLRDYGPRLGIFALLVAAGAGIVGLRAHLKAGEAEEVSRRLDAALAMPEADHDGRIGALKALLKDAAGCEAEPWILLALGNQLYKKAEDLQAGEASAALNLDAHDLFIGIARKHPAHAVAPLALFSAGCAAEQLGNGTEALRLYNELQQRYPSTYLVVGGENSLTGRHSEGLQERITRLKLAFPNGVLPPTAAPEAPTSEAPPAAPSEAPAPAP